MGRPRQPGRTDKPAQADPGVLPDETMEALRAQAGQARQEQPRQEQPRQEQAQQEHAGQGRQGAGQGPQGAGQGGWPGGGADPFGRFGEVFEGVRRGQDGLFSRARGEEHAGFHDWSRAWPGAAEEWSAVVPIRPYGKQPPLFMVHGGFGSPFTFHALPNHLSPDQPLFGLQAQGLDGRRPPLRSIPEMAACYLAGVREMMAQIRPEMPGRFHLAGYSFGGWVAYEMARQLRQEGWRGRLTVLGLGAPPAVMAPGWYDQVLAGLDYAQEARRSMAFAAQGSPLREAMVQTLPPPVRVMMANMQMGGRYRPEPITGGMHLVVTREQAAMFQREPRMGWDRCCREIELVAMSGHHLSMFREPEVRELGSILTEILERPWIA